MQELNSILWLRLDTCQLSAHNLWASAFVKLISNYHVDAPACKTFALLQRKFPWQISSFNISAVWFGWGLSWPKQGPTTNKECKTNSNCDLQLQWTMPWSCEGKDSPCLDWDRTASHVNYPHDWCEYWLSSKTHSSLLSLTLCSLLFQFSHAIENSKSSHYILPQQIIC